MEQPTLRQILEYVANLIEHLGFKLNTLMAAPRCESPHSRIAEDLLEIRVKKLGIAFTVDPQDDTQQESDRLTIVEDLPADEAFVICRETYKWFPSLEFVNLIEKNKQPKRTYKIFVIRIT